MSIMNSQQTMVAREPDGSHRTGALFIAASLLVGATVLSPQTANASGRDVYDQPMDQAWPVRREWDAQAEVEFGRFVAAIGEGVARHRCGTLARCLNNPRVNPLYIRAARPLAVHADCGDVPYTLRAYFAFRSGLPFIRARDTVGAGRDRRYRWRVRPWGERHLSDFSTPRQVFSALASDVDSGFFRMGPDVVRSDTYPVQVNRQSVRPGSMYYNPNGHVLVVWRVDRDGTVHMIDGHPDNSISYKVLRENYPHGCRGDGGGFRNWRPLIGTQTPTYTENRNLTDLSDEQFDRHRWLVGQHEVGYQEWVRARLRSKNPDGT